MILYLLLFLAFALLLGLAAHYSALLAILLLSAAYLWVSLRDRARRQIQREFQARGVTIDRLARLSDKERERLQAPKNAWSIRYRDNEGIQYWALAAKEKQTVVILRDDPREEYESGRPPWKPGNSLDIDILHDLAKPSAAQRYFQATLRALVDQGATNVELRESHPLPDLPGAPAPTFATFLQAVKIAGRSTEPTGSAPLVVHGDSGWNLRFNCTGESGARVLTLSVTRNRSNSEPTR